MRIEARIDLLSLGVGWPARQRCALQELWKLFESSTLNNSNYSSANEWNYSANSFFRRASANGFELAGF